MGSDKRGTTATRNSDRQNVQDTQCACTRGSESVVQETNTGMEVGWWYNIQRDSINGTIQHMLHT